MPKLLIKNIAKLYTLAGFGGTSGHAATSIDPVINGELEISEGAVTHAGPARGDATGVGPTHGTYPEDPEITSRTDDAIVIDAKGALVTPGLVDPHTHAIYGGNRAAELPLKLAGVPYLDILAKGGGILSTVRATRAAADEELLDAAGVRLMAMAESGTTTVEIKTGYGLSTAEELRLLSLIHRLASELPLSIVTTYMGAHAVPQEFQGDTDGYVAEVIKTLALLADAGPVSFVDVFCEPSVFSIDQSRTILERAREVGYRVKIHADEIEIPEGSISGAELAAQVGATSADHLRATGPSGFHAMRDAGVTPVVLPGTSFCLRDHRYASARIMIDEFDLPVALATDCNPGTSPTESLQMVMALAALELRMTPMEILAGVTMNAARAIDMQDRVGSLEPGKLGDAVIWQAYDLEMLSYRFGSNQAAAVIKAGNILCGHLNDFA